MTLQFDPQTGEIKYKGKTIGNQLFEGGRSTVRLSIEYESGDDWIVPLSWFAHGLSKLEENACIALLTLETAQDSIDENFDVQRFMIEKQVKRKNYVWHFHKTDADDWPSPLHGHDYDKGLKLDAITGDIYDAVTRKRCKTLKQKDLQAIQGDLRSSKDFRGPVHDLIDNRTSQE